MPRYKHFPCVANGLLFIASVNNKSSINVRVYRMSHSSREIIDHDPESSGLQLQTDNKPEIIQFKSCVDPNTGLSLPVLVVLFSGNDGAPVKIKSTHGGGASGSATCVYFFGIQYTTHKKEILPLRYCQIEYPINRDITVLSDMVIMWIKNHHLHTAIPSTHRKTILCEQKHQLINNLEKVTKHQLVWVRKLQGISENSYLVLSHLTKQVETSDMDMFLENNVRLEFLLVLLTQQSNGQWCQQELSVSDLIPEVYAANLVTLLAISCKLKKDSVVTNIMCTNLTKNRACQTSIDSHVIVLLEDGYFLELKCGQIQKCFQLDHPSFQKDFSYEIVSCLGRDSMEQFVVIKVQSSEGTECLAVDMNNKKVSHCWPNAEHILTGDFIRLGKQQLLVLFSDWSFESCSGSWVLTDFGDTQIDTRKQTDVSSASTDADTSSNVQAVVKALASRLQKSRISLQEDENDLTAKKKFVLSTWDRLEQRSIKNEISGYSDLMVPMVTLVEGCQTSGVSTCNKPKPSQPSRRIQIDLKQVWQHVVGDRWVVGIKAVNNSHRSITDCVISLVSNSSRSSKHVSTWPAVSDDKGGQIAVKSLHNIAKRLKLDVKSLPLTSKSKKTIRHGETATVTCCSSIPSVDVEREISCSVILYFVESNEADSSHTDVISVCCGEIVFRVQDYIDGKYSVILNEHTESEVSSAGQWETVRAALDCAQQSVELKVCSTFTVLCNIGSLLVQRVGFAHHEETKSFICCHCEVLNLVRIQIQAVNSSKEVILRVSARDESQILLTVQYLYSHLADDLTILPNNDLDTQNMIRNSLSHIADEIHHVTTAVQGLCATEHQMNAAGDGLQEYMDSDNIGRIQDSFKQQQHAFQDQIHGCVSKEKYDEFLKQIQTYEQQTDHSFSNVHNL